MTRTCLLAVGILVAMLPECAHGQAPQRHAVVIGINEYADPAIPPLKYAETDAKAVYETLIDPAVGRFPKENVALLLGKDATPSAIKAALYKLRGVDKDDLVVVFYSGHGAKEGDEGFWVTQNAETKALPATALANSDIRKFLAQIPSEKLVVLLDCCYAASTVKKSLNDPAKLFGDFTGKGRVTIAGAADNQEALEFPEKKEGVFTYYLVEGLRGGADFNKDGVVTFEELWQYLGDNVRKASVKQGGLHEPVIITEGGVTPQFLLTFNPTLQAAANEAIAALRKLFEMDKITGAQYDLGRKALSGPAFTPAERVQREVFSDLAAGNLDPKYLDSVLRDAVAKLGAQEPSAPAAGVKPTLAVVPFQVLGDLNVKDAGTILAERLLPYFAEKYQIIDQTHLKQFLDQDTLTMADLAELAQPSATTKSLSKAVKLRGVRTLVVGTISSAPDGLTITARLSDWQTGKVESARIAQTRADDWRTLMDGLGYIAGRLCGSPVSEPVVDPVDRQRELARQQEETRQAEILKQQEAVRQRELARKLQEEQERTKQKEAKKQVETPSDNKLQGTIILVRNVSADWFAELSIGSTDGVKEGMIFEVFRQNIFVNHIKITLVDSRLSVGVARNPPQPPKVGDIARWSGRYSK
ncbi:MAG TPA: caspase family protein [Phycisphaerae bacterium]|nr:caspase family protein [Phycisphaerae bacterium]